MSYDSSADTQRHAGSQVGAWEQAKLMMQWVSALGVQPAAYPAIGDALAEDVSARIAHVSLAAFPQKARGPYALEASVRGHLQAVLYCRRASPLCRTNSF